MKYVLTLIFACGHGCGEPSQVTIPTEYETRAACEQAGQQWMAPNANPQHALKAVQCVERRRR